MKRRLLLISAVLLLAAATSRSAAQTTPSGGIPVHAEATVPQTGAPQSYIGATPDAPTLHRTAPDVTAVAPSGGIGEPASYSKATPQPRIADGIPGEATWWNSFGHGYYVALRPDLGRNGDLVVVCGGTPFHCRTAQVITSCACKGPNSDRLVDLSLDLFSDFADPSVGVVRITLQIVGGN